MIAPSMVVDEIFAYLTRRLPGPNTGTEVEYASTDVVHMVGWLTEIKTFTCEVAAARTCRAALPVGFEETVGDAVGIDKACENTTGSNDVITMIVEVSAVPVDMTVDNAISPLVSNSRACGVEAQAYI